MSPTDSNHALFSDITHPRPVTVNPNCPAQMLALWPDQQERSFKVAVSAHFGIANAKPEHGSAQHE
jgi:hypothetical protein